MDPTGTYHTLLFSLDHHEKKWFTASAATPKFERDELCSPSKQKDVWLATPLDLLASPTWSVREASHARAYNLPFLSSPPPASLTARANRLQPYTPSTTSWQIYRILDPTAIAANPGRIAVPDARKASQLHWVSWIQFKASNLLVRYCSQACQTSDWTTHKNLCPFFKAADITVTSSIPAPILRKGTTSELVQLRSIISKNVVREGVALGLDPDLLCSVSAAELYEIKEESELFWRLDAAVRAEWEAKADASNRECRAFLEGALTPIRLPCPDPLHQETVRPVQMSHRSASSNAAQVNALLLSALFPHLLHFTTAQNTALLNFFTSPVLTETGDLRMNAARIIFGHGEPNKDLIAQLIHRCIGWAPRTYEALIACVALPIQKNWPDVAGNDILDAALASYLLAVGKAVPYDWILKIAETSPVACKHLLPAVVSMCKNGQIQNPGVALLRLFEALGVTISRSRPGSELLLFVMALCTHSPDVDKEHMLKVLQQQGTAAPLAIEARMYSKEELVDLMMALVERLGYPPIPIL
ncbi:hypothetical protein DFH06DRAFT_1137983 [Mycena polygramma]|nr:hypothetical protein DFH06DRAFT_1137983 [Mycena polygramma]